MDREGSATGTSAAIVGSAVGAYAGFFVFGAIGFGVASLIMAGAPECTEKLCGLGQALAAVVWGIVIAAVGAITMMLLGCRYALVKKGFDRVGPTLVWLAFLAPAILIAGAAILPDALSAAWVFATPLMAAPAARRVATKRRGKPAQLAG
ncbi:MAG TPA: hypothetical protein VM841_09745 [Actinomycetota bacterium]|nr:hypothetical protein [Actinomycetota bacterium]